MEKKWYRITKSAEDVSYTYVELTDAEYKVLSRVLNEVEDNSDKWCGSITISEGYETIEEAQKI